MHKITTGAFSAAIAVAALTGCSSPEASGAAPAPTVTVTEIAAGAPPACLEAIRQARKTFGQVAEFADIVDAYPPMVLKAFNAGMNGDTIAADEIVTTLDKMNTRLANLNGRVNPDAFKEAAQACENN